MNNTSKDILKTVLKNRVNVITILPSIAHRVMNAINLILSLLLIGLIVKEFRIEVSML